MSGHSHHPVSSGEATRRWSSSLWWKEAAQNRRSTVWKAALTCETELWLTLWGLTGEEAEDGG